MTNLIVPQEFHDQRPPLDFEIVETKWKPWYEWARYHHYLHDIRQMPFSTAFGAFEKETGQPVAFVGISGATWGQRRVARACRLVVAPEWQGAGVGIRFLEAVAEREARGEGYIGDPVPTYIHTAHPALCAALRRSKRWRQISQHIIGRPPERVDKSIPTLKYGGHTRSVAGFKFLGIR